MTGWRIHAWVLLRNHYHLFVETPEANLSNGMQWLQQLRRRAAAAPRAKLPSSLRRWVRSVNK